MSTCPCKLQIHKKKPENADNRSVCCVNVLMSIVFILNFNVEFCSSNTDWSLLANICEVEGILSEEKFP